METEIICGESHVRSMWYLLAYREKLYFLVSSFCLFLETGDSIIRVDEQRGQ